MPAPGPAAGCWRPTRSPVRRTGWPALRMTRVGSLATDARVAAPPVSGSGAVPAAAAKTAATAFGALGLAGLVLAGGAPGGVSSAIAQGWTDLERAEPLRPGHRFPAYGITRLVTATAVLRLIVGERVGIDDPALHPPCRRQNHVHPPHCGAATDPDGRRRLSRRGHSIPGNGNHSHHMARPDLLRGQAMSTAAPGSSPTLLALRPRSAPSPASSATPPRRWSTTSGGARHFRPGALARTSGPS